MKGFKSGKISYVDWCYSLYVWEEDGKINKNEKTDSSESCQRVPVQTEGLEVLERSFQNLNEGLKKGIPIIVGRIWADCEINQKH